MRVDLRLALPAACAWLAAFVVVGLPDGALPVALVLWAAGGVAVAVALALRRGVIAVGAVCLVAAALVASAAAAQGGARRPPVLVDAAHGGRFVSLTVVTGETLGALPGAASPDPAEPDGADSGIGRDEAEARAGPFAATVTSATVGDGGAAALSVPVLVFGEPPPGRTGVGAELALSGTLTATEPGDDAAFLVFASGSARVVAEPPWYLDWANTLRARFAASATALPGDGGDLLPGLAIGDTAAVSERLDTAMKSSSLSHLTAVSGANCAIVVALVMVLGGAAGLGRGGRIAASVCLLVAFVVLVTPQASVVRAAAMALIVLLAMLGGRPVRGVPVLSLAVLVLLASDPWLSRSYGFALSVLATGGLLVLSTPLTRVFARVLPRGIAAVLAIPVAAQLACQPVLLMLQPSIPTYGVVANVLAEPAAPLATVVGLLACVTLPVVPWLGGLLATVAWLPASWIAAVAGFFAGLPGSQLPWPPGIPGVLLLAGVTVAALVAVLGGVPRRARLAAACAVLTALACGAGSAVGGRVAQQLARPDDWQIAVCDIGQGDAVLVRSAGRVALVDAGPLPERLGACLDTLGIGRIDLLVLSHFDLDHVGGTEAVIGRVDRAIVGPSSDAADDRLLADLAAGGAVVERVSRGDSGVLGELRFTVLWPRARLGTVEPGNDASVALEFAGVGDCASGCLGSLFLGDLGEQSQALMLAAGPVSPVDVVKVSHHGSADQLPRLYERASATVGLIGVGADNDYGHPTDELLDLLAGVGTTVWRTDTDGLILVSPAAADEGVRVWSER